MLLDDLARAVEIAALALHLLEAARLPHDHRLGARLARLEFGAVGDAVAQLAHTLADVGGGLPQHAPHFASGLHRVEARDALPMLASRCWTQLQVGRHVVAALVFGEVGLASCVPTSEAAVANALGGQHLLAVVVLRLGDEDIFKGLRPLALAPWRPWASCCLALYQLTPLDREVSEKLDHNSLVKRAQGAVWTVVAAVGRGVESG